MKRFFLILALGAVALLAQDIKQGTNSFFDDAEIKTYPLKGILVEGEVENPGLVDLGALPLRNCPVKEVELQKGRPEFKGAFFYSGYSLYDILNARKVQKAKENSFAPPTDLYVIVANDKGEKAAFSWGEIYYSRDNFRILLSKSVQAVNPSKLAVTKWALPDEPRLICANDFLNVRFVANPTRIMVKSSRGDFAAGKPKDVYAPEIRMVNGSNSVIIREINSSVEKRTYSNVGYGHGMGFKGVEDVKGFVLKDVIRLQAKLTPDAYRDGVAVMSARDGYRCVFSLSEIMNRNDNLDFLLLDRKDVPAEGRYVLFATPDFFVDRNIKAIEKIEIVR